VSATTATSERTPGTVRTSSSMRLRSIARPASPMSTSRTSTIASSRASPLSASPAKSVIVVAISDVGLTGGAHGVPVCAAWSSRTGSHGTRNNPPATTAPATRHAARTCRPCHTSTPTTAASSHIVQ
jgi:hypothetical protein